VLPAAQIARCVLISWSLSLSLILASTADSSGCIHSQRCWQQSYFPHSHAAGSRMSHPVARRDSLPPGTALTERHSQTLDPHPLPALAAVRWATLRSRRAREALQRPSIGVEHTEASDARTPQNSRQHT